MSGAAWLPADAREWSVMRCALFELESEARLVGREPSAAARDLRAVLEHHGQVGRVWVERQQAREVSPNG